jgi:threonylcarbamoyladenosine tRNA methylthiotransferase MtaB
MRISILGLVRPCRARAAYRAARLPCQNHLMRVFLTNLGCKLNQAENEQMALGFLAAGHEIAASLAEADLHVVNSCTVTAAAARSSRQAARAARRRAGGAPAARTVLTGCYATASAAEAASLDGVDMVVANRDKDRLVEAVLQAFTLPRIPPAGAPGGAMLPGGHTRALLKVEDGCDMGCTFCIIPSTRGRQHSRPAPAVLAEARRLIEAGYREIVVTGVQISAYRTAASTPSPAGQTAPAPALGPVAAGGRPLRLAGLVQALLDLLPPAHAADAADASNGAGAGMPGPPPVRLRLTSIAPWELDGRLLALWSDGRLCRHLHLSLQSGATATLRRMRRPYTAEAFRRLVARARAAIPGVAITTDVIVGFPGETATEFAESLQAVAALGFSKVHVFPFSARPGTPAALLPDAVPPAELRRRMEEMLRVAARCEEDFRRAHLGQRAAVLWERPSGGRGQGLTDNYIRVWCDAAAGLWNQVAEVELTELIAGGMIGRLVAPRSG